MQITRRKRISGTVIGLLLLIGVTAYVLFAHVFKNKGSIAIGAVGDIMIHNGQLADAWDTDAEAFDFTPAFAEVTTLLKEQDLMLGNLETTCSGPGAISADVTIYGYTGYPLFNTPDEIAQALKQSGFDLLSVANNHALDGGPEGWTRTVSVLHDAGLVTAGDTACTYQKVQGLNIAVLAATYGTNGQQAPEGFPTLKDGDPESFSTLLQRVQDARENADLVVLLLHDGEEYASEPSEILITRTDALIAAGCDMIFVSHAHVPGPAAKRTVQDDDGQERQGLVLYGLGNFISAQEYTEGLPVHCERGMMARVELSMDGQATALRLYPTQCVRGESGLQIELLRDEEGLSWFEQTVLTGLTYTYQTADGCFSIDLRKKEE